MSISRALGAEKPAAKRPRSYMEGPCGRKLSIMSTGLPNTPSQKSKDQILSSLGGTQGRIRARTMSISRALGAENQPPSAPEATWKDPVAEKQPAKSRRKRIWKDASRSCIAQGRGGSARARAPPPFYLGVPSARAGFFLYIYLSISTYLSLYIIYIYIYLSLSLSLSLFLSRSSFWRGLRRVHVCATKLQ